VRLTDLKPHFLRYAPEGDRTIWRTVLTLAEAQGLSFLCPLCWRANGNTSVGTHSICCWSSSRGVPDDATPGPGRWRMTGTGFDDLTLSEEVGKSRSILLTTGCGWHGFITAGEVHE
jgi:hypothetical protein